MEIFKVMIRNRFTGTEYADSYWQKEENAQKHIERSKSDDDATGVDSEEWHYWIAKVETTD